MSNRPRQKFEGPMLRDLYDDFLHYNTLGHVDALCSERVDFIRGLTMDQKQALTARYEETYPMPDALPRDIDHANAHLVLELQRGAYYLSTFAIQQLRARERDDLLAIVRGSHRAAGDHDLSRLSLAHRLVDASPPTHADAP